MLEKNLVYAISDNTGAHETETGPSRSQFIPSERPLRLRESSSLSIQVSESRKLQAIQIFLGRADLSSVVEDTFMTKALDKHFQEGQRDELPETVNPITAVRIGCRY